MKYILLAILCLIVMAAFIYVEHQEKYLLAVILKGLASLCFVIFGMLSSIQCLDMQMTSMIKNGLVLGLIADILLNLRYVFKKGKIFFLVGILVFLAGHVMYLCALVPKYDSYCFITALAGVVLSALILKWIFTQIEAEKAFKIFGVFYIGVIVVMNAFAIRNVICELNTANIIFLIGAISFLISDIVLILNTFGKETKFSLRITNLSLYYIGQLLIALSMQFLA